LPTPTWRALTARSTRGAAAAKAPERNRSVGIRVDLPFEQEANPFVEQAFEHKTFFTRLHHFVLSSDAFVVAPGGIGTVLELMMVWQLLQVRHVHDTPLILVGKMWADLVDWAGRTGPGRLRVKRRPGNRRSTLLEGVPAMDPNYALSVLGVISITALGVYLRLRWGKGRPDLETRPKRGSGKRKK
jgi:hypothetical protein